MLYGTDLGNGPLPATLNLREIGLLADAGLSDDDLLAALTDPWPLAEHAAPAWRPRCLTARSRWSSGWRARASYETGGIDDRSDPLEKYRDRFVGADTDLVYFDGNSLGRPLKVTAERLRDFVTEEWGGRLIRGWDERWFDLPLTLGDEIGRVCLGAAPGQVAVGDSTTVLLYKLMRAAVAARPGRTEIVIDRDNFPTDRYVADGVARECGLDAAVDRRRPGGRRDGRPAGRRRLRAHGAGGASHVAYRSAYLADGAELTRIAHDAGALVLVGPVALRRLGAGRARRRGSADLAVGCTYKYLNGGPGLPGLLLRRRPAPRRPHPADPGLDGRDRTRS